MVGASGSGAEPAAPAPVQMAVNFGLTMTQGPNHSATWFSITLPSAGHVRLQLFDIAGRSVATLYDGDAPMGRTAVSWNGRASNGLQLTRGAYFAHLTSGALHATQKLVLIGE